MGMIEIVTDGSSGITDESQTMHRAMDSMRLLALQMFIKCENVHTEYIC